MIYSEAKRWNIIYTLTDFRTRIYQWVWIEDLKSFIDNLLPISKHLSSDYCEIKLR